MKILSKEQFWSKIDQGSIKLYMIDSCIMDSEYYKIETVRDEVRLISIDAPVKENNEHN